MTLIDGSVSHNVIGIARLLELANGEVGITEAVMSVVEVAIALDVVTHKDTEGLLRLFHLT